MFRCSNFQHNCFENAVNIYNWAIHLWEFFDDPSEHCGSFIVMYFSPINILLSTHCSLSFQEGQRAHTLKFYLRFDSPPVHSQRSLPSFWIRDCIFQYPLIPKPSRIDPSNIWTKIFDAGLLRTSHNKWSELLSFRRKSKKMWNVSYCPNTF